MLNNLAAAYGDDPLAAMGVAVRIAQVPEFLVMGVTIGVLPLLAYAFGKGDAARLRAALRGAAFTVGTIVLVFSGTVFVFREQVFTIFSGDHSVLAIGLTILTAQLVATIVNGFTGLLTSLFQATGMVLPAMVLSMAQGVLFIPIVVVGNLWFGLAGIIWALTVTRCSCSSRAWALGGVPGADRPRPRRGLAGAGGRDPGGSGRLTVRTRGRADGRRGAGWHRASRPSHGREAGRYDRTSSSREPATGVTGVRVELTNSSTIGANGTVVTAVMRPALRRGVAHLGYDRAVPLRQTPPTCGEHQDHGTLSDPVRSGYGV